MSIRLCVCRACITYVLYHPMVENAREATNKMQRVQKKSEVDVLTDSPPRGSNSQPSDALLDDKSLTLYPIELGGRYRVCPKPTPQLLYRLAYYLGY